MIKTDNSSSILSMHPFSPAPDLIRNGHNNLANGHNNLHNGHNNLHNGHSPSPMSRSDPISRSSNHSHSRTGSSSGGSGIGIVQGQLHNNHSRSASVRDQPDLVDVKINDIVGNGVSGILYKWVNYGKGWRRRWFVLQDGVLAYYKIHGPDRIVVNKETEKGAKVIGEDSRRRVSRNGKAGSQPRRKPFGEVHLKVSSIRESRSDDRRFSIYTGTKRLHLRAESREDRIAWMEALRAVKDMFPRMSNSELMAPVETAVVSTEKLRQRLQEEGVRDEAIKESEQIMKSEFASMQNQLVVLKQKQWLLLDTLRQLETEKVDLENTVVDESQRQLNDQAPLSLRQDMFSEEATASETDDDNERVDVAEEETDEEDNIFFDTCDFMSSSSFKSCGSDHQRSSSSEDDGIIDASQDDVDPSVKTAGFSFPHVKRRKKLPDPLDIEKGVSLWSMIRDNIGKDLTKVDPVGVLTLEFDDGEVFQWSKVTTSIYNLILGKLYCDHYGTMRIQGDRDYSCKLKFKEQSIIDRNPHQVQGVVLDKNGKTVATLFGKWDESMHYVIGDSSRKGKGLESPSEAHLLWRRSKPAKFPTRYNLTRFAITLNELTPGLKEKLPPTDSRLRPDQRYLENGEYDMANSEKLRLEQRQRQARKLQERGWKPRWFAKDKASNSYRYIGSYWESREEGKWESCPDIFGQVPSEPLLE